MRTDINAEIIAEARILYEAGLNVFPVRYASKQPFGTTTLLTTARIHSSYIPELFTASNIGVMTGRLSRNLVVLDNDDDETFEHIDENLRARQIRPWVRMGARGGQHWLLCAEGEVQNANLGKLQILGNRQITIAPPSLHPEGVFYAWGQKEGDLPPTVSINQLDFLKLSLVGSQKRDFKRDKTTLPPVAHRVLVEGDTTGYASNSEAEYAACLSLLSMGMPDVMIRAVFAQFNPPHYAKSRGRHFDTYTLERARTWLSEQTETTRQGSYDHPHSAQFVSYADSRPWPGRTGGTDKVVFVALCRRMEMDKGARIFRASIRELSELANVGTQAVQASLQRLKDAGLLRLENRDSASSACLYSLISPAVITTVGEAYTAVTDNVVISAIQSDAFHRRGLGKSAYATWRHLLIGGIPLTIREIAEATGRTVRTISTSLSTLESHGLARKAGGEESPLLWTGCEATTNRLQEIAIVLGTDGKTIKRREQHLEERQKRVSQVLLKQKRIVLSLERR